MLHPFISCWVVISPAVAGAGELERAIDLFDKAEAITISADYVDESLEDVIEDLNAQTPIQLRADWRALESLGAWRTDDVTLQIGEGSLSMVLAGLTLQFGDEFERPVIEAWADQMILTTQEATVAMRMTDVYDVRDLLADGSALAELRAESVNTDPPIESSSDAEPATESLPVEIMNQEADDDDGPDEQQAPPRGLAVPDLEELLRDTPTRERATPGEELMIFIADHVDADAWTQLGGTRAEISERNGVLFVTASANTHRKFRDALRRLRRTIPAAIALEAAIVELPRQQLDGLTRRYDLTSQALARAVLLSSDCKVYWSTSTTVVMDRELSIESESNGVEVTLDLTPHFEKENGALSLEVRVTSSHEDDRRSVRTTMAMPFRGGGAITELPASSRSERARLVILIPRRM